MPALIEELLQGFAPEKSNYEIYNQSEFNQNHAFVPRRVFMYSPFLNKHFAQT